MRNNLKEVTEEVFIAAQGLRGASSSWCRRRGSSQLRGGGESGSQLAYSGQVRKQRAMNAGIDLTFSFLLL